ncbi:exodeoxyribonuclease VII large subunit [Bosea sp. (in: a-proteobacteria)]|uniref:exodeoxyribonuclease VII large subunit n=1 Tax=Bosea sp. (in: a-proteobacteria) TaxID=1871050 RepID=UPI00121A0601|nr:exodeoxyribonuclease VII large subunit [Bosea sp. (in: a-proteobacteria)]TAJ33408.1 MAG: exodeoxyribonuclease VII large subunit [Bosea sp. (in: a-proteobacteria)]
MDSESQKPAGNAPEWSVSDLSGALKRTIEDSFGFVRVRGEISGYRGPVSSGHVYFSLKDANAKIDAVIWKGVFARLKTRPQEGLEVIATGKITTFAGKSSYQIVIDSLEPAGIGALMALLDERRKRLAAEGLFAEERKRAIPYLPRVIGVVTSPTGAVIRDILHRLEDRFPRHVLVWPVRVQGETSAAEVANAITGFNALAEQGRIPRPDVLIVARGGGSLEDLMGFNEEVVVRAAADSRIPLVSAVGHETDWTLIDHAADLRAPTPTGAAEKVVPVRAELMASIADLARRHAGAMRRLSDRRRGDLRALARALPGPEAVLSGPRQRLDLAATRLAPALARNARAHEIQLQNVARRLAENSPRVRLARLRAELAGFGRVLAAARSNAVTAERTRIATERARIEVLDTRMRNALAQSLLRRRERSAQIAERGQRAFAQALAKRTERLASLWALIRSLGPAAVLARGYALIRDESGALVRGVAQAEPGRLLDVQVSDGHFGAIVAGGAGTSIGTGKVSRPQSRPARKEMPKTAQGDLF